VNPVTGGLYVGMLDPLEPQKELARRMLQAREQFRREGPSDAQPLPLSDIETFGRALPTHLLSQIEQLNFDQHPAFKVFAAGIMAPQSTRPTSSGATKTCDAAIRRVLWRAATLVIAGRPP
jgi:hypothetical protein